MKPDKNFGGMGGINSQPVTFQAGAKVQGSTSTTTKSTSNDTAPEQKKVEPKPVDKPVPYTVQKQLKDNNVPFEVHNNPNYAPTNAKPIGVKPKDSWAFNVFATKKEIQDDSDQFWSNLRKLSQDYTIYFTNTALSLAGDLVEILDDNRVPIVIHDTTTRKMVGWGIYKIGNADNKSACIYIVKHNPDIENNIVDDDAPTDTLANMTLVEFVKVLSISGNNKSNPLFHGDKPSDTFSKYIKQMLTVSSGKEPGDDLIQMVYTAFLKTYTVEKISDPEALKCICMGGKLIVYIYKEGNTGGMYIRKSYTSDETLKMIFQGSKDKKSKIFNTFTSDILHDFLDKIIYEGDRNTFIKDINGDYTVKSFRKDFHILASTSDYDGSVASGIEIIQMAHAMTPEEFIEGLEQYSHKDVKKRKSYEFFDEDDFNPALSQMMNPMDPKIRTLFIGNEYKIIGENPWNIQVSTGDKFVITKDGDTYKFASNEPSNADSVDVPAVDSNGKKEGGTVTPTEKKVGQSSRSRKKTSSQEASKEPEKESPTRRPAVKKDSTTSTPSTKSVSKKKPLNDTEKEATKTGTGISRQSILDRAERLKNNPLYRNK